MDTHDPLHMLHGHGADWSTVDATDDDLNERSDLSPDDLAELGLRLPRSPCPTAWWQTTDDQAEHLGQPSFTSSFNKVRWFALRGLEDQASLTNGPAELDRIKSERNYWLGRTEADDLFERFRLASVGKICRSGSDHKLPFRNPNGFPDCRHSRLLVFYAHLRMQRNGVNEPTTRPDIGGAAAYLNAYLRCASLQGG